MSVGPDGHVLTALREGDQVTDYSGLIHYRPQHIYFYHLIGVLQSFPKTQIFPHFSKER